MHFTKDFRTGNDVNECPWILATPHSSPRLGARAHCWHSHFHFSEMGIRSRVSSLRHLQCYLYWRQWLWTVRSATKTSGECVGWRKGFVRVGKLGGESEGGVMVISRVGLTVGQWLCEQPNVQPTPPPTHLRLSLCEMLWVSVSLRTIWCTRWTTTLVHWWMSRSGWTTRSWRRCLTWGRSAGESGVREGVCLNRCEKGDHFMHCRQVVSKSNR